MREPYLYSDFAKSNSLPAVFDSDLENFWTQKSNLSQRHIYITKIGSVCLKLTFNSSNFEKK